MAGRLPPPGRVSFKCDAHRLPHAAATVYPTVTRGIEDRYHHYYAFQEKFRFPMRRFTSLCPQKFVRASHMSHSTANGPMYIGLPFSRLEAQDLSPLAIQHSLSSDCTTQLQSRSADFGADHLDPPFITMILARTQNLPSPPKKPVQDHRRTSKAVKSPNDNVGSSSAAHQKVTLQLFFPLFLRHHIS